MGQNATERGFRNAVLASPLREFEGYRLAIDCGASACGGERVYAIDDLSRMYGGTITVGRLVIRLRCRLCGGAARACFLETGPELAARGRMRRVALVGPERQDPGR